MKFQRFTWSCGSASVVNAFKCFSVNLNEAEVIPVAGTVPAGKCKHCREVAAALKRRKCKEGRWKCECTQCDRFRKAAKGECVSGTTYDGILAAVRHFGADLLTASEFKSQSRDEAWLWLHGALIHARVVILCVSKWSHWCLAFSTSGDRVTVFDPQNTINNKKEHGIHILPKEKLMKLWWNGTQWKGDDKSLYAISIGKR